MNNRPIGGRGSQTGSHPIDMIIVIMIMIMIIMIMFIIIITSLIDQFLLLLGQLLVPNLNKMSGKFRKNSLTNFYVIITIRYFCVQIQVAAKSKA
jgi:hypothetical protein